MLPRSNVSWASQTLNEEARQRETTILEKVKNNNERREEEMTQD
jgi:hypothetical protein